jgi:hypothetical protein
MDVCRQFGDLVLQVFDVLAVLVNLREVGGLTGTRRLRGNGEIHGGSLEIRYYNNI